MGCRESIPRIPKFHATEDLVDALWSEREKGMENALQILKANSHLITLKLINWIRESAPVVNAEQVSRLWLLAFRLQAFESAGKTVRPDICITAYQKCLDFYTQELWPKEWASTHNNLGIMYYERGHGDRIENLQTSISHFEQALIIRTESDMPDAQAHTIRHLGIARTAIRALEEKLATKIKSS